MATAMTIKHEIFNYEKDLVRKWINHEHTLLSASYKYDGQECKSITVYIAGRKLNRVVRKL